MEISPVAGIRIMPEAKSRSIDPELSAVFDIESAARPGDDTYSGPGRKAAGAEEDEEELDEEPGTGAEDGSPSPRHSLDTRINFFA